jgi:hypothetical protein
LLEPILDFAVIRFEKGYRESFSFRKLDAFGLICSALLPGPACSGTAAQDQTGIRSRQSSTAFGSIETIFVGPARRTMRVDPSATLRHD